MARDPDAWLRTRGLDEKEARILRGIDPAKMRRFRDIHARDRASVLRALFGRTAAYARPGTLEAYARAHPYGNDDDLVEVAAFAAFVQRTHSGRGQRDIAARDLVTYEANWWRVARAPPFDAHAHHAPSPGALQVAQGLAVFPVTTDIRPLVEVDDDTQHPPIRAQSAIVMLRRDPVGITSAWIEDAAGQVLTDALHGWTAEEVRRTRGAAGARALDALLEEGILR